MIKTIYKGHKIKYFFDTKEYYDYISSIYVEHKNVLDWHEWNKNIMQVFFGSAVNSDECKKIELIAPSKAELGRMVEELNVACFYVNDREIIKYPALSEFEFHKIIPAEQAYQEIEYYLFNILQQPDAEMPVGTDKEIAFSKGYDKNSFRKEKRNKGK